MTLENYGSDLFEYDILKIYFGEPYKLNDQITITQPTIGDILEFGDNKFYSVANTLCANTTTFRLSLWDMGIDWNKISDFELFISLIRNLTPDNTRLLFGDLNFSWFIPFKNMEKDQIELIYFPKDENGKDIDVPKDERIVIDELLYLKMVNYLRLMLDIHPKAEKAKGKTTKEWMIEEERMNQQVEEERAKKNGTQYKSVLLPLVSSMINHPGFKYKKNELKEVGIFEFKDSIKRILSYEDMKSLSIGMYFGMIDTKKMNDIKERLDWVRDLYVNKKNIIS